MSRKITLYLSFKLFHFFLACLAVMGRPEATTNSLGEKKFNYIILVYYAKHYRSLYTQKHKKYLLPTIYG